MSIAATMIAPLALLLPTAGAVEPVQTAIEVESAIDPQTGSVAQSLVPLPVAAVEPADGGIIQIVSESFRIEAQGQVRIEQRTTIRVTPRPMPLRPNMLMDLPSREISPHRVERNIGRCLPVSGIAGVQVSGDSQLLLFLRDRRMVSATLERACRARDFYSGFYLERNGDGQLCVKRDTLLSRSGANCKLTRMKQLVEAGD